MFPTIHGQNPLQGDLGFDYWQFTREACMTFAVRLQVVTWPLIPTT